ncbi:MAG: hypothetical protein ACM3XO_00260 [Bacteroidota bacterium]
MKTEAVDFDLHGIVGIRLINATPADIAAVKRQLGPIQSSLSRTPDIVIRFVEKMQFSSTVRYLGVDDAGFTDDAFFVFRGKQESSVKVQIPFDKIGSQQCEIVCESGLLAVPLLIAIINMTALSKGVLPVHATALIYNGKGVLLTGWSKGGKTETLLAFAANGAQYVGDEWIYLSNDGNHMHGIPEPTRIWLWHLQEMPEYMAMVSRKKLLWLRALNTFAKSIMWLEARMGNGSTISRVLHRFSALVKRQLYVQLPPEKLFGQKSGRTDLGPEKIFWVVSHENSNVEVQQINEHELAQRTVFSLQEERMEFLSYYMKYRFAFPECSNPLIDQVEEVQRRMLVHAFAGRDAYAVYHPYPFSIPSIFEKIQPYCA